MSQLTPPYLAFLHSSTPCTFPSLVSTHNLNTWIRTSLPMRKRLKCAFHITNVFQKALAVVVTIVIHFPLASSISYSCTKDSFCLSNQLLKTELQYGLCSALNFRKPIGEPLC